MRRAIVAASFVSLTGCVTTTRYEAQVARAVEAERQASDEHAQIEELKKTTESQRVELDSERPQLDALKTEQDDVQSRLKAADEQVAALTGSNKELSESLEAKKPELAKKVARLIKELDEVRAQVRDLKQKSAVSQAK